MAAWARFLLSQAAWVEILTTLLVLLAGWAVAQLFLFCVDTLGRRWARRTASTLDDQLIDVVRKPLFFLILLLGVYAALHRYKFRLRDAGDSVLFVLSVMLVVYTAMRTVATVLGWYGAKVGREREGETIAREMVPLTDKVIKILLLAIGLAIVFDHFGIEIRSILVTLGVGSLAIGLALQDTLANMFGGFTIMLDRPFRIGDRIQLQTGELGDVQGIGMRSTSVLLPNGNLLIIPNAHLVKNLIINHSYPDSRTLISIDVGVASGTDVALAKRLMLEAASQNPRILEDPAPQVFFKSFGEAALNLSLACHVKSFRDAMPATDEINSAIDLKFRAASIQIPSPIRMTYPQPL